MNHWSVSLSIARTHLLSKLKSTVTAALGVTFGIGAYITLVSFMTGLNTMLDDLILNQTPHIHIYNEIRASDKQPLDYLDGLKNDLKVISSVKPKRQPQKIRNALPLMEWLNTNPEVRGATPRVNSQVFYLSGSIEIGGNLTGIDAQKETFLSNFGDYVPQGDPSDLSGTSNNILLGAGLAEKLSLGVGDHVQLANISGELFPFKVVGIYQSGIAEIDNVQSFANLVNVQKVLGVPANHITDIHVKLNDINKATVMAEKIEELFTVSARDINEANAQYETGTSIRNLITYAVSITLLIVAGFGIYNILNMLIYEKMNDIAILKATGFTGRDVARIFLSQALIIGVTGGVIGLLIGYVLSALIDTLPFETEALPTISTYPVNHDPLFYLIGISFALLSTFLAGYLPSRKAGKIDPVQIIRGN